MTCLDWVTKLNYFLKLNKILILIIFFILSIIFIIFLVAQNNSINKNKTSFSNVSEITKYDILKPKFSINNLKEKIAVTAQAGNFISNDEVLLKNDVIFKSKKFEIFSNNVLFNQKNQTASSNNESIFISNKTKIESQGFNILEEGSIIQFNGKTSLIISQWNF